MSANERTTGRSVRMRQRLRTLRKDALAAVVDAVVSVPDGLASAALAGVNPVYGLYTSIAAPIAGSLLVSAQLMQITTTSATALAAKQSIAGYPAEQRDAALFLLAAAAGAILIGFGLLRLGRLVRFVSHAVMTGFLAGVAVVLILDQLGPLVGVATEGGNEVVQLLDLLANVRHFSPTTVAAGSLALILAVVLRRTRLAPLSALVALVVPSAVVAVLGWSDVQRVVDVSEIPYGVPSPAVPNVALLTPELLLSALSLAVVVAIQGAGVSQSVENPDGRTVDPSRDLLAQGAANVASGLLSGIPAGGSVGQTALNVAVGARSRWSGILHGLWMLGIVLVAPRLIEQVPMAVLAAIMIIAGVSALDLAEARSIWNTGGAARWSIVTTFLATLVLSVPIAVATGFLVNLFLRLSSAASDVTVVALVPAGEGRYSETTPPARLPSEAVTVLDVHGSLFFAGAHTLREALPSVAGATRPAVVLRLRGRTRVSATLVDVLDDYADVLGSAGGRLYLSGVDDDVSTQLRRTGKLDLEQVVRLSPAESVLGSSTEHAVADARAWLGRSERGVGGRDGAVLTSKDAKDERK